MKTPILSLDLIVLNEKKQILLGKITEKWRNSGKYLWGLPGREIEFGETLLQSAERSLFEETNLQANRSTIKHVNSSFGFNNHFVAVGVVMEAQDEPVITKPDDWEEWRWFTLSDLPEQLFPSAKITIEAFKKGIVSIE